MTEVQDERPFSCVTLNDDNRTMLINGDPECSMLLPKSIARKNANEKIKIIAGVIRDGCEKYRFYYFGEDTITNCAKEIVDQLDERPRVVKTLNSI